MSWSRFGVIAVLTSLLACGGATQSSWTEPPDEFWKSRKPVCPDGGQAVEERKDDTRIQVCKKNSVEHGPKVVWAESGQRLAQGLMRDGEMHGRWRQWRPDGKLSAIVEFKDGELDGASVHHSVDGARLDETYRRGKLHGQRTLKGPKGTLLEFEQYENGALHGEKRTYYENGKLHSVFHYQRGVPDGVAIRYAKNGGELGRFTMKAGSGVWREWYDNGKQAVETHVKGGVFQGEHKTFHENGNVYVEGRFDKGKEVGTWTLWNDAGVIESSTEYVAGVPKKVASYANGTVTRVDTYHDNGHRQSSTGYVAGKPDGMAVVWRSDGTRLEQGLYAGGKKQGDWYRFREDGTVERIEAFKKGKHRKTRKGGAAPEIPMEVLTVGVDICDQFLERFLGCEKMPRENRLALPDAWEQLAERKHAASRRDVEAACRAAAPSWQKQLQSLGC
jgi:antitoxin component YwqK of YwqJK toxin-antitoxin module